MSDLVAYLRGQNHDLSHALQKARRQRDEMREALEPMLQYVILCIRQARQDKLSLNTIQVAERDLKRAQDALANLNKTDTET